MRRWTHLPHCSPISLSGLSLATSSSDKFTRDVRSVDIPSNTIALAISRFPAFCFNSRIPLTFRERCAPCALDPLAVGENKKKKRKQVNDLQRDLLFLPFEDGTGIVSRGTRDFVISLARISRDGIPRDSSSYFTLAERIKLGFFSLAGERCS